MNYLLKQCFLLPSLVLAFFLAVLSGCSPVLWSPTWSHDSGSFVFIQDDGTVSQYNLNSQSAQALFEAEDNQSCRIAISPDDKFVAIAEAKATNTRNSNVTSKGHMVKITLVRLSDKKVVATKTRAWGDPDATQERQLAGAYWCPSGKRVLIRYNNFNADGPGFAVYDVESEELAEMDTLVPETLVMWFLGGLSPIVPDGSGYLALKPPSGKGEPGIFVFVDWEGNQYDLVNTPEMGSFWETMQEDEKKGGKEKQKYSILKHSTGEWNENVLTIFMEPGCIVIDPKKRVATLEPLPEDKKVLFEEVPAFCEHEIVATFPDTDLQVRYYRIREKVGREDRSIEKVEFFDHRDKSHQAIAEGDENLSFGPVSPDGKYVLVSFKSKDNTRWFYVIRSDGTIVAKVKAS